MKIFHYTNYNRKKHLYYLKSKLKKKKYNYHKFEFYKIQILVKKNFFLTHNQIESFRRVISNKSFRNTKFKFFNNINIGFTKKPIGSRMGKGTSNVKFFKIKIKAGTPLVELQFKKVNFKYFLEILKKSFKKLPIKVKLNSVYNKNKFFYA